MDHSLHETQDIRHKFVTFNGPKQLWWVAMVVMCTTSPRQASMSYEHQDHAKMVTMVTSQNTTICNFKWTKTKTKINQMWWTIAIAMCTTPPRWASMNYEHYNCIMMTTTVLAQEHQNHNMIKKTIVINSEELDKNLHFGNQSWKKIHEWWILGENEQWRNWQFWSTMFNNFQGFIV
jgi:hypothetical protein